MSSHDEIAGIARNFLRDFPRFFEIAWPPSTASASTLKLPHPLVEPETFTVVNNLDGEPVEDYYLDHRNGLVKIDGMAEYTSGLYVSGHYYEWFTTDDLVFHAQLTSAEHFHDRVGVTISNVSEVEVEVIGMGTVVSALVSLWTELSTDIDVSTPEGMNIPARQRAQQVERLLHFWTTRYNEKAAMLNVGLNRVEMVTLRRRSRTTNRLVPVYREREFGDPRPPIRVFPPIDPIGPSPLEDDSWGDGGTQPNDFGWTGGAFS